MSTKRIPKIIHQIWYQGEEALPEKYTVWRQSIIQNNPNFEYRLWSGSGMLKLLQEHYPHLVRLYQSLAHMHMKIDMMKLIILYEYGGVYLDMDCQAYRDFTPAIDGLDAMYYERCPDIMDIGLVMQRMFCVPGAFDYAFLNNNFIASVQGHWFLQYVVTCGVDYVTTLPLKYQCEKYSRRVVLEAFGPRRLTHCYHAMCELENDIAVFHSGVFESSEFERLVGQFYGIDYIHKSSIPIYFITHSYEVTWMNARYQQYFHKGYDLLAKMLRYHYASTSVLDKVKGCPWYLIQLGMSFIKWRCDLTGKEFLNCPYSEELAGHYCFYSENLRELNYSA